MKSETSFVQIILLQRDFFQKNLLQFSIKYSPFSPNDMKSNEYD